VPDALLVSARTGKGIAALEDRCREMTAQGHGTVQLLIPLDRYDLVARLHKLGHVQEQEHREDGVLVTGRFPPSQAAALEPYLVKGARPAGRLRG
jgi:GTP-binding protein HflX